MDAVRPAGSTSYSWPTNVLSTFNLRRNELGLVAWAPYPVGGTAHDVYVPLRVSQTAGSRSPRYQLTLLPGVELTEVYLSLAPIGSDGRVGAFIKKDEPLKYGYYPADRAINIQLPALAAAGIYSAEIKAVRRGGGSASAPPFWFYHSGR
jgi:hypothetical protein